MGHYDNPSVIFLIEQIACTIFIEVTTVDIKGRIRQLMDERGWTCYRIAKEADIPWSTIHNMFKRNTEPSIQTLEAICKGLGITLAQFFDVENNMGLSHE